MRFGGWAGAAGIAFVLTASGIAPASAAPGDALMVTGDGVNVRAGPSTQDSIRMRVYSGQQVIELERQGEWVRAEIAGANGEEGWIHGSLVAPAGGAPLASPPTPSPSSTQGAPAASPAPDTQPSPEVATSPPAPSEGAGGPAAGDLEIEAISPSAGPLEETAAVRRFRETVDYLNNRAVQVAGVDLFTGVAPVDAATVQVETTDAWTTVPPAGQRSYLNTLVDRWSAAQDGEPNEVRVQIVDVEGILLMEEGSTR